MADLYVVNILDFMKNLGEERTQKYLSDFSCAYSETERNSEIEHFLSHNAIEFAKKRQSITYFVIDNESRVVGMFVLCHKPILISAKGFSNRMRRMLQRGGDYDEKHDAYNLSAFLIAQFSKNFGVDKEHQVSGTVLMEETLKLLSKVQDTIGGGVVFLECEPREELLGFYTRSPQKFYVFGERESKKDGVVYKQLLRFLKSPRDDEPKDSDGMNDTHALSGSENQIGK